MTNLVSFLELALTGLSKWEPESKSLESEPWKHINFPLDSAFTCVGKTVQFANLSLKKHYSVATFGNRYMCCTLDSDLLTLK